MKADDLEAGDILVSKISSEDTEIGDLIQITDIHFDMLVYGLGRVGSFEKGIIAFGPVGSFENGIKGTLSTSLTRVHENYDYMRPDGLVESIEPKTIII